MLRLAAKHLECHWRATAGRLQDRGTVCTSGLTGQIQLSSITVALSVGVSILIVHPVTLGASLETGVAASLKNADVAKDALLTRALPGAWRSWLLCEALVPAGKHCGCLYELGCSASGANRLCHCSFSPSHERPTTSGVATTGCLLMCPRHSGQCAGHAHVLLECYHYNMIRQRYFSVSSVQVRYYSTQSMPKIFLFLLEILGFLVSYDLTYLLF